MVAAYILCSMVIGGITITPAIILLIFFLVVILSEAGKIGLDLGHLTVIKARLPAAFTVGFVVLALPMTALVLILKISPLLALTISAILVLLSSHFFAIKTASSQKNWLLDIIILLVAASAILFFSKVPISSQVILGKTGTLPVWNDYFIHGATIASLGSPLSLGGNIEFAGNGYQFYHYASFIFSAIFHIFPDISGLALSTSMLLPMGLLFAVLGGYVLAVELSGRIGGVLALTALLCIPAYAAFIQSGWFDFYWLLFTAPGSGYAIGVACVACASAGIYLDTKDIKNLFLVMLLLFSLILIRAHMFILLTPALVTMIIVENWLNKLRHPYLMLLSMILFATLALKFFPNLHEIWMSFSKPYKYLNFAQNQMLFHEHKIELFKIPFLTIFTQLNLILISVLGGYFILYPILALLHARYNGTSAVDILPLLLIVCFLCLMLFSPVARNGDASEYKHRHFVLLYAIIAIYTMSYACNLLEKYVGTKLQQCFGCALAIVILAISMSLNYLKNPSSPDTKSMPWAGGLHNQPITPGLIGAASYMATHSRRGDIFSMDASLASGVLSNPIIEVISLSGVPAYISRPELYLKGSECARKITIDRLHRLEKLSKIDNWPEAKKYLQTYGIRWFLVPAGQKIAWDITSKYAVFSNEGISVYDSGYLDGYRHEPQC